MSDICSSSWFVPLNSPITNCLVESSVISVPLTARTF